MIETTKKDSRKRYTMSLPLDELMVLKAVADCGIADSLSKDAQEYIMKKTGMALSTCDKLWFDIWDRLDDKFRRLRLKGEVGHDVGVYRGTAWDGKPGKVI